MRIFTSAMVVALLLAAAVIWWMHDRKRPLPSEPSTRPALLIVSGDTAGWITPCGCTANQSGGLLRRGTYLAAARQQADVLYADAGGAVTGNSLYQRVKFEAILNGEQKMGLAAHNIGKAEASFGAEYLREAAGRLAAPLVSSNVMDAAGHAVAEPVRIVSAGGRRIAITGVLSPKFVGGGLRVIDPRQAILAVTAKIHGQYDSLVVLAYLPVDELNELAASLPEADAVIGGPTGQAIVPHRIGPILAAAATNKGKFLVEISISPTSAAPWEGRVVELNGSFADQEAQLENLRTYLSMLSKRDFTASETGLVPALASMSSTSRWIHHLLEIASSFSFDSTTSRVGSMRTAPSRSKPLSSWFTRWREAPSSCARSSCASCRPMRISSPSLMP